MIQNEKKKTNLEMKYKKKSKNQESRKKALIFGQPGS